MAPDKKNSTTDKTAVFRLLRELAASNRYFTFGQIRDVVRKEGKAEKDKTLYDYLHQATAEGIIHHAGKGWYSSLSEPLPLGSEAIQPIADTLQQKFPMLPVSCWSTAQLNPYLEHLMGIAVHFVTVEADAVTSVVEHLKESGFNVVENPRGAVLKNLNLEDGMVIVRPGSLWENYSDELIAPWEVLLVHASQEVKWLKFIDRMEFRDAVGRALSRGRVSIAPLLAYLRKMKIPELDIFPGNCQVSEKK
jgi:hypothetical protein